jgi:alkylhydroperoxidase/carboxymuconolactone decarboxylase family protein YurZ
LYSTSTSPAANGCTEEELKEALTHLAFDAGWPQAKAAMACAKKGLLAVTTHEDTTTGA